MRNLCGEIKDKLNTPVGQWRLDNNKYINIGNGSYPAIYTHSTTYNMKHGANTYDCPTNHAGALNFKQTQSQDLNTPNTFKSEE